MFSTIVLCIVKLLLYRGGSTGHGMVFRASEFHFFLADRAGESVPADGAEGGAEGDAVGDGEGDIDRRLPLVADDEGIGEHTAGAGDGRSAALGDKEERMVGDHCLGGHRDRCGDERVADDRRVAHRAAQRGGDGDAKADQSGGIKAYIIIKTWKEALPYGRNGAGGQGGISQ